MKYKVDSHSLYEIIQILDNHISNVEPSSKNKIILESLLNLRNNLIKTHQPDNSLNWQIQNTTALDILDKLQWTMVWM